MEYVSLVHDLDSLQNLIKDVLHLVFIEGGGRLVELLEIGLH